MIWIMAVLHLVHSTMGTKNNVLNIYLLKRLEIMYIDLFSAYNCPASNRVTKKTIKVGSGDSVIFNTNPDAGNK